VTLINYTEEQTQQLILIYLGATDKVAIIDELALMFKKPKKSIVGKLSKEGVYVKRVYKSKNGRDPVTKKEMIHTLAKLVEGDVDKLQGFEKAPKLELEYLIKLISTIIENDKTTFQAGFKRGLSELHKVIELE
jgi:hypothetical protein